MMDGESSFEHIVDRELFVLRWIAPCVEGVLALHRLSEARAAEIGGPLTVITLVREDMPVPDAETRAAIERTMQTLGAVRDYHTVLLGSGLKLTVLRSMLTAIMIVVGVLGKKKVAIHKDVASIARLVAARPGHDAQTFVEWLHEQGFIDEAEAEAARAALSVG